MSDSILEMRIKFLEAILRTYNKVSDNSGIQFHTQESTIDSILEELNDLYRQRREQDKSFNKGGKQ